MSTENNKMIAEFMGVQKCTTCDPYCGSYIFGIAYSPEEMRYHTSWDWLMPVVEKIESLGISVEIIKNDVHLKGFYYYAKNSSAYYDEYIPGADMSKIESTVYSIIKFIEWLNQNNY
jgi:hypothetical protein